MKGTSRSALRRPAVAAVVIASVLACSGAHAGATTTTTVASTTTTCGVVVSPAVHFVSKNSPCVIRVRVGTYVHIKFRSAMRWSNPVSNSDAVAVSVISRSTSGVNAATLHALAVGRARIVATGTYNCLSGTRCPDLAMLWSLQVIVS